MKKTKVNLIENINCHVVSIIILMNAFQIIIAWDFGIIFNMWIEYAIIAMLFILNKFKMTNIKNILIIIMVGIIFGINILFNNNDTLNFYINQFLLFALPLLLIFLLNIDLEKFTRIFYGYNIVNAALYLLLLIINPNKLIEDYMTFGFYAIYSLIYVIIYAYYHKHKKMMICGIIALPAIFINGNRGTVLIAAVAIIAMVFMNERKLKKKIIFVAIIVFLACNINNLAKFILNFIIEDLGINSYAVQGLYLMLEGDDVESIIGGRYNIYEEAAGEFKEHFLSGMGIANFQEKYGYYPHNIFLDVYSTFGIIMGSIYFAYIIVVGVKLYKLSKNNIEIRILFIFMLANIMKLILSKTFIYDPTIWLYISLGNFIITKYGGKDNENNSIYTNIQ